MGMMFFLEINAMILSPLFVEAWHAVDFRRTLLDFIIDDKLTRENPRLSGLLRSGQAISAQPSAKYM
jgi:hypothetical protein